MTSFRTAPETMSAQAVVYANATWGPGKWKGSFQMIGDSGAAIIITPLQGSEVKVLETTLHQITTKQDSMREPSDIDVAEGTGVKADGT